MSRGLVVAVLITATLAGAAGFLVSMQLNDRAPTASVPATTLAKGDSIPDFTLTALDGTEFSRDQLDGRPTLINFWATWCAPCRREMPELMDLHDELNGAGQVVGIALDERDPVQEYVDSMGIDYPILLAGDLSGHRLVQAFGNRDGLLPYTVVVDADGVIQRVVLGTVTLEDMRSVFEPML